MSRADLRAFRWPLAALQHKLATERDALRLALAAAQGEAGAKQRQVDTLQQRQQAECELAGRSWQRLADAGAHARSLAYLVQLAGAVDHARDQVRTSEERLEAARAACLATERQLSMARRLRQAAEDEYTLKQSRVQAREADLAWLARWGGRP